MRLPSVWFLITFHYNDVGVYSVRITSGGESIASDDARLLVQYDENAPDANVNTKLDLGSLVGASGVGGNDTGEDEADFIFGGDGLLPRLIAS